MRVAAVSLQAYRLPLKRPWVAARTVLAERSGMLLALADGDGHRGWGDCAPLPSSGEAGHRQAFAALRTLADALPGCTMAEATERARGAPAEVCWALDCALHDLQARRQGVPLVRLLGGSRDAVPVNAALGALDDDCAVRAERALADGYRVAKIKVGVDSADVECERLHALHRRVGGRLRLRLDANRAWSDATAARFLRALADLPIDGVEEPLAQPTPAGLAALQADLPFAIAVDESLPELGIDALLAARAVRRWVVKPARLGGMAATQALAGRAAAAGVELVLTSVVDSAVGVAAAAHLAAALDRTPQRGDGQTQALAHGLATGAWLAADVGDAGPCMAGQLHLAAGPGIGFVPAVPPGAAARAAH